MRPFFIRPYDILKRLRILANNSDVVR